MNPTPEQSHAIGAAAVAAVVGLTVGLTGFGPPWPMIVVVAAIVTALEFALNRPVLAPPRRPETEQPQPPPRPPEENTMPVAVDSAAWYGTAPSTESNASEVDPSRVRPAPAVATYLVKGDGRHPQCPNCGRHDVKGHKAGNAYAFECSVCSHSWTWMVGQAWPQTTADPVPGR